MKITRNILAAIFALLLLVLFLLVGCNPSDLKDGYIMEGVSIAGVEVGGMTKEDALSAVRLATLDTYPTTAMIVHIGEYTIELSPEVTCITLDPEAAVDEAYKLGRHGTKSQIQEQKLQAMTTGLVTDISGCFSIKWDDLYSILSYMCKDLEDTAFKQTYYEITGETPDLSAEEMPEQPQVLVVQLGVPAMQIDVEILCDQVMESYVNGVFETNYSCGTAEPDTVDLDAIYNEYASEPVSAVMDPETFEVSDHAYGYGFDLDAAKELLSNASYGDTLEIPFVFIAPEHTKEQLSSLLFRDVLAEASAYSASSNNRATNLRLACEALDGTVLMPGQQLSYNYTLGERTPDKGWKPAGTYVGGETIDTYGGGICQPSSVLYYCCLLADLEIVNRACHQYISSYVDPGMDATVFWDGVDFVFANNTDYPIRIDAKADGGRVTIALIGTDTKDYYIDMEYEILNSWGWKDEVVEIPEDDNPKGYKDGEVITTPYSGYKVVTYKCRYDKETDKLIERTFEATSVYESRNRKTAKIIPTEPEETEPTEPETEPTEPETEPTIPETEPTVPETEPTVPPETEEPGQPGQGVGEG